ncbi:hypothetical protein [Solitalea koreensis]|uniref:Uncharacterized protein n=1 Tax=Solitalea koreensis TaxID=543615 RepID=A0A521DDJ9_9SPHI|nr:hypothetical protein [Solitalea koreensis]SMO69662.1 hypothetical protein SAMN06265350_106208 [Solitalea koreensis]
MIRFVLICSLCLLCSFKTSNKNIDLDYIRNNYEKSVTEKEICEMMIKALEQIKLNDVTLAYLGALQIIWANHTINPLTKLSTFKKGKTNIDKALKNEKDNIEIRFIRLSVQKNCPQFLGYNKNILEDERYLREHVEKVQSENLKKMINNILNK